ncbi:DUF1364 domain-containing protein (plasmid) [Burkholderia vietnamiensis]|uniref:DUF1364 family protein n=1 Tax=Burkholderia vietnamiensis (strain G4 / LMG 22486) TaxID=269482 RepID=A4JWC7_BURVG|nr:hypothetical protein Bcep1808_7710 [Burkholderia vietnamiensis G4]MCB4349754.1 DUF1364 domain-containing protein [Burkholderia vietnamiensis]
MSKITDSARGETCALRLPGVCNRDPETTVWAHGNDVEGGKAKGKKLLRYDHIGCYACYSCHMVLDGQAKRPAHLALEQVREAELLARAESAQKLKDKGLWPTDEQLARKPVTAHKPIEKKMTAAAARAIVKKVTPLEERAREERKPRPASRPMATGTSMSTRTTTESRWPKRKRKLQSANRLQSRPFGGR